MLPRMILAAIATGLSAVWLWILLRVQKIDWRMAAYCRVLQNQQKIDEHCGKRKMRTAGRSKRATAG